jgi:tyrosyl-tRNA synthetase
VKAELDYVLKRGVAEIIVESELRDRLARGEKLRLKEGFDPSFPDIHLGHTVGLRKLRQFQEMGHQVVLIVGDWTARIGDPSGASVTRPMLTEEAVRANAETYMQQFFKVVDKSRTEVRWQSEWFGKFGLAEVIKLTSRFTVAQMLAREDFSNRYQSQQPISVTELLYPMLQAYDSVVIEADVEFGGTDQKFNLLLGRELQAIEGQTPQQVLMTPLLVGTDGGRKMSKSLGNYVGVAEPANDQFGKLMSIKDELIISYFELLTDVPDEELANFGDAMNNGRTNPMEIKKRLAREVITQLHSQADAVTAEANFARTVQNKELPDEIPEHRVAFGPLADGAYDITEIIVATGQAASRAEAKRFITQGAVSVDGEKISARTAAVSDGSIIKVGKRSIVKVFNTDRQR